MNILQWFGFVLRFGPLLAKWGPLVLKLVRTVEKLLSDAPSEQKKQAAMAFMRAALERAGLNKPHLLDAFGHFVNMLVALLHARGEFKPLSSEAGPAVRVKVNVPDAAVAVAMQVNPALVHDVRRVAVAEQAARDARLNELEQKMRPQ